MIHTSAIVQTDKIGEGTRVWQFVVILQDAVIGKNCNINFNSFIENDVIIGDNVTVKSGVYIWDGIRIGNDVFIGPSVAFVNNPYPRSQQYPDEHVGVIIQDGASIGANSTILGGITIGKYAMIGAGSVVTKDIPANTLWFGNPAEHRGYVTNSGQVLDMNLVDKKTGIKHQIA